ncbi:hypothetical protein DHEL01_v211150 [Diaporthe helianthi]|uniref:Uncharacterized protein n=1 Tax=Diaporthe helianthi TaxID=158607 RepID=A0A2P5HJQ4_DIAHE|nr:hypothetical protein DHEL01_v211150 [Diaporthe helianthi]
MFTPLAWTIWALAASLSLAEATFKPVEWIDLMVATSRFPRFFGEPPYISRTDPPKVSGLSYLEKNKMIPPFGKIVPLNCSSNEGKFSCPGWTDCEKCFGELKEDGPPAYQAIQARNSSLGHKLDGLTLNADLMWHIPVELDPAGYHTRQTHHFSQNMGGITPIDNTMVNLGINKWQNGSITFAPEVDEFIVYKGEFDPDPNNATCRWNSARDTASQAALNQPFWSALNTPEYHLIYTVQDGRLYLTWRFKFDLKKHVDDNFFVWVNARNCSDIVAAASEQMDFHTISLYDFKKEQRRLMEERGIDLGDL